MRTSHILLLLFLTIPLVEIYFLISVGQVIGTIWTVFLVVFTAVLGAALLRSQGLSTLRRVQEASARGEIPALEMIEGLMLLVGGALLLTPGFFTDAIGFICLITPLRQTVIRYWIKRYGSSIQGQSRHNPDSKGPQTLEGEYWKDDE
ncbi:MAG: FxsA family protein [Sulfuriflexus sp.]|nr:FxsA family protein [Sulfuriflexus sp.]